MPKNSFLQAIFPSLKYSVSPIEKTNKGTTKIGKIVPVYSTILNGKESLSLDLGHLLRFMPTNVPVMEGYEVNFEAFKVSLNALAYASRTERKVMDFHNIAENDGTEVNPFCHKIENVQPRINGSHLDVFTGDFFRPGLLGDYLNFPSMKSFRDYVREWLNVTPLFDGSISRWRVSSNISNASPDMLPYLDFIFRYYLNDFDYVSSQGEDSLNIASELLIEKYIVAVPFKPTLLDNDYPYGNNWYSSDYIGNSYATDVHDEVSGTGLGVCFIPYLKSLFRYICEHYPLVQKYYFLGVDMSSASDIDLHVLALALKVLSENDSSFTLNYLDVLYKYYKIDAQTIFDEWFNYVCSVLVFQSALYKITVDGGDYSVLSDSTLMSQGWLPDIFSDDMKPVDWTKFAAYWKIISDWYINTNIDGNPDDFYLQHCNLIPQVEGNMYVELEPFTRRWKNDIFTSAVPSALVNDVLIPTDGTIPQLREANAYQKLRDILKNTGSRLRDVLLGVRGYRPSAMASHMAVPVGTLHSFVGISSVLQTTPTTPESAQGNMSGIGIDSSHGRHLCKVINNEEPVPCVVMVMMSVTQNASYFQGFSRDFFRTSVYDFAVPQLANIGEQEVMQSELYFDYDPQGEAASLDTIFGFNRRYYDWFFETNEIHGNMRDSEDYWHGARIFDSRPSLNEEFIGIENEADHLSRIFANQSPSSMPIYYNVVISGEKVVSLPRYIQYDL